MNGQQQDGAAARDAYASLVDRLVARLGYGTVVRLTPKDCWQPEIAQSFELPDPEKLFDGSGKKIAGLAILYVLPPRRGLFGCLHIRSRLMWLLFFPTIRQHNLSGRNEPIRLFMRLARNGLRQLGGWPQ